MKLSSKIVAIKSVDKFPSGKGLIYYKTEEFIDFIENKHIPSLKKETLVLRPCESETWKFGFIKQVDKGQFTTVKDLNSWRLEHLALPESESM